jgi:cyclic pyranopterin phosphate synthase
MRGQCAIDEGRAARVGWTYGRRWNTIVIDALGRNIEYLRISLTEHCNLACVYCRANATRPDPTIKPITIEEIERILACMVRLGIRKVRLTGGEPLLRADLPDIITLVKQHAQITDIALTTNAQGLAERVPALKAAGLTRLNISLDSLKPTRYRAITGGAFGLSAVLAGIDAAVAHGLLPIKLNCVVMRGVNDDELDDFIALARDKPFEIRFIELMPLGAPRDNAPRDNALVGVSSAELLARHPELRPQHAERAGQPAALYTAPSFRGVVGFISPLSRRFCADCNRVRVTSDAKLRPCLGDNTEIALRDALLQGDEQLFAVIRDAIYHKPQGHHFNEGFVSARSMNRIGG